MVAAALGGQRRKMSKRPRRQDTQPPPTVAPQAEATGAPAFFLRTKLLPPRPAPALLHEVLDLVDQQLIVVLDDYHHLGMETPVHVVVDRLLAYLPDVIHVIIISRDVPPLALSRLRAHNALTIIDRAELLFTDEET